MSVLSVVAKPGISLRKTVTIFVNAKTVVICMYFLAQPKMKSLTITPGIIGARMKIITQKLLTDVGVDFGKAFFLFRTY